MTGDEYGPSVEGPDEREMAGERPDEQCVLCEGSGRVRWNDVGGWEPAAAILANKRPEIDAALKKFRAEQTEKVLAHSDPRMADPSR